MVKHPVAKLGFHLDAGTEQAPPPQKAADGNHQNQLHHGHTDDIQQEIHVEGAGNAVHFHGAVSQAVDDHAVKVWNDELGVIDNHQGNGTHKQQRRIAKIIAVDMFA